MGKLSKRRKAHFCNFCGKLVSYFYRHLINQHGNEHKVIEMLRANGVDRTRELRKIMGEGDRVHNEQNPSSLIVRREASAKAKNRIQRLLCTHCDNRISDANFRVHVARCAPSTTQLKDEKRRARLFAIGNLTAPMDEIVKHIYLRMREGPMKAFFGKDRLLIEHAAMLAEKYRGESQEKMISTAIRTVSRIILIIRDFMKCSTNAQYVTNSEDCFRPGLYKYFVLSIKRMAGAGEAADGGYQKPSIVDQYGRAFRTFSKTVLYVANEDGNDELVLLATKWQQVYDATFSDRVSSIARKQADRKTDELRQAIPMMEDVSTLINYFKLNMQDAYAALSERFDPEKYKMLVMTLLLRLWIFNRERVREVDRLLIKDWNSATQIDPSSVEFQTLLPSEQICASSFKRISVKGKLGRMVALLLLREDEPYFDYMLSSRTEAGVALNNPYLFARADTFVEGTATMRKFADECGARNPSLLRGTKLRKHLAVSLQYASLTPEDLRQVAETLGHTHETHLKFYRHPLPALHLGRVSKLFAALDAGDFQSIRGRQLEDIEVDTLTVQDEFPMDDSMLDIAEAEPKVRPDLGDYRGREPELEQEPSTSRRSSNRERKPIRYRIGSGEESAEEDPLDGDFVERAQASDSESSDSDNESLEHVSTDERSASSTNPNTMVGSNEDVEQAELVSKTRRLQLSNRCRRFAKRRSAPRIQWTHEIIESLKEQIPEELRTKKIPSCARSREICAVLSARFPALESLTVAKLGALVSNLLKKPR